jgi:hypothetical protein
MRRGSEEDVKRYKFLKNQIISPYPIILGHFLIFVNKLTSKPLILNLSMYNKVILRKIHFLKMNLNIYRICLHYIYPNHIR